MIPPIGTGPVRVDGFKIRDYLLNAGHPQNGGKAALFEAFGFTRDAWKILADSIAAHVLAHPPRVGVDNLHGTKLIAVCEMQTPDGRHPCMTTIWILDKGQETNGPRLVTCYRAVSRGSPAAARPRLAPA
jgi:filamentous hemagglutinin